MNLFPQARLRRTLKRVGGVLVAKTRGPAPVPPARPNPQIARTPVPLHPVITRALAQAASAIVRTRVIEGILLAVIVLTGGLLATCLADWLVHTPRPVRVLLFITQMLAVGTTVWLRVVQPISRRPSDREAALRLQKKFPSLRSAPISAIELSCGHGQSLTGSSVLVERLGAETAALLSEVNPTLVASPNAIAKLTGIAAILVLLNAAWITFLWPDSPAWLARWPGLELPPPTRTIVRDVTTDLLVRRGENVELRARADGVVPRSGRVRLDFSDGITSEVPAVPVADGNGEFSAIVTSVQISFRYTFLLNDGRGSTHHVKVVQPPAVAEFSIREIFPAYTGLAPKEHAAGNLDFLAGSTVELRIKATQELREAEVVLAGTGRHIGLVRSQGSSNTATGSFKVPPKLGGLSFPLVNKEGTPSVDDTVFRATSTEDQSPELALSEEASRIRSLTPEAEYELLYTCTDDFGLSAITLRYAIVDSATIDAPPLAEFKPLILPLPRPGETEAVFVWKPGSLPDATPGKTIFFFLEAADNRVPGEPGVTRTGMHSVALVTQSEKLLETLRRAGEAAREIRQLGNQQFDVHNKLLKTTPPATQ